MAHSGQMSRQGQHAGLLLWLVARSADLHRAMTQVHTRLQCSSLLDCQYGVALDCRRHGACPSTTACARVGMQCAQVNNEQQPRLAAVPGQGPNLTCQPGGLAGPRHFGSRQLDSNWTCNACVFVQAMHASHAYASTRATAVPTPLALSLVPRACTAALHAAPAAARSHKTARRGDGARGPRAAAAAHTRANQLASSLPAAQRIHLHSIALAGLTQCNFFATVAVAHGQIPFAAGPGRVSDCVFRPLHICGAAMVSWLQRQDQLS